MSIISEAYFIHVDTKWDYVGQFGASRNLREAVANPQLISPETRGSTFRHTSRTEQAREKGHRLFEAGCMLSEFGSRRRRTYRAHDIIIRGLIKANEDCGNGQKGKGGKLAGTSNLHFAQKYDLAPIGTVRGGSRFPASPVKLARDQRQRTDTPPPVSLHGHIRLPTSSSWVSRPSRATKVAMGGPWICGKR